MTQEEKQLLLIDLCTRLPYEVFIRYHWSREATIDEDRELDISDIEELKYNIENPQDDWCEISWKPYLRSMSSMTENERKEYMCLSDLINIDGVLVSSYETFDWLNNHHFDYRGLIEKGLAIEAPEGMYEK
jgi:hypothetical protein